MLPKDQLQQAVHAVTDLIEVTLAHVISRFYILLWSRMGKQNRKKQVWTKSKKLHYVKEADLTFSAKRHNHIYTGTFPKNSCQSKHPLPLLTNFTLLCILEIFITNIVIGQVILPSLHLSLSNLLDEDLLKDFFFFPRPIKDIVWK